MAPACGCTPPAALSCSCASVSAGSCAEPGPGGRTGPAAEGAGCAPGWSCAPGCAGNALPKPADLAKPAKKVIFGLGVAYLYFVHPATKDNGFVLVGAFYLSKAVLK